MSAVENDPLNLMASHDSDVHIDVTHQDYTLSTEQRSALKSQTPVVVWLTGLSGSGKSTLADAVERRLHDMGLHTTVLDGDNIRTGLSRDLGFSAEDRQENVRRVSEVARLMFDAGLITIVALVSPFRSDRDLARTRFADGDFVEVFVQTPAEVCAARDPKGLYRKAAAGGISNLSGVGQRYEDPIDAELVVRGDTDLSGNAEQVIAAILSRQ